MVEHWRYNGPPVYMSVAAYLGLVKKKPDKPGETEYGDLGDLAAMFEGSGGMIQ